VIGRSSKSFLPPENVAQSGLVIIVDGFGARVTSVRLRLDEHAAAADATAVAATIRSRLRLDRLIAEL